MITGPATRGGVGGGGEAMAPYFFAYQKEKIETKEKIEKISMQKLLKCCHQG